MIFQLEKRVRKCASFLEDNALLGKLIAGDMIALGVMYHSTCLLNLYRECNQKEIELTDDDTDKQIHKQVLSELAQYMEQVAKADIRNNLFKLVGLAKLFKKRVTELDGHTFGRVPTTKLKNRLLAHVENLKEYKDKGFSHLTFDENVEIVLKSCMKGTLMMKFLYCLKRQRVCVVTFLRSIVMNLIDKFQKIAKRNSYLHP